MNIGPIGREVRFAFLLTLVCGFFPSSQAQTYSVVHNFSGGADGANPYAGITIARAGNLLGTASGGGLGYGTVFKLKYAQSGYSFGILYTFTGGGDGAFPYNGVVIGSDGSLYGTTYSHGSSGCGGNGCGTVFNLRPPATFCRAILCPWIETGLYMFMGNTDGAGPTQGTNLIFDQMGNIYGTTLSGGAYDQGTVYKLTRSGGGWVESVIHEFGAAGDGTQPLHNVIFDTSGNLYGTTSLGGANNNGVVFQLAPSGYGWTENILASFSLSGSAGGIPYAGLIIDQSGNLYGATSANASGGGPPTGYGGGGAVFELIPSGGGWTLKVLYNFSDPGGGYHCGPYGNLVMDASGNLYGTTYSDGAYGYGSVFKLTPASGQWIYTSLHDFCSGGWPCADGALPSGDLTMDANGSFYGTTSLGGSNNYGLVWKITP